MPSFVGMTSGAIVHHPAGTEVLGSQHWLPLAKPGTASGSPCAYARAFPVEPTPNSLAPGAGPNHAQPSGDLRRPATHPPRAEQSRLGRFDWTEWRPYRDDEKTADAIHGLFDRVADAGASRPMIAVRRDYAGAAP
jgi:hypothetical protein